MNYETLTVKPLTGGLGAELLGVDLARQDGNAQVLEEITRAFHEFSVIFFRNQKLTPEQHIAFGRKFGTLNVHPALEPVPGYPEILRIAKDEADTANVGNAWHSDLTCLEQPPLGSILYAKEVPVYGGDTLFANMYLAYESLSAGMRRMLDGLVAVHSAGRAFGDQYSVRGRFEGRFKKMKTLEKPEIDDVSEHPVVRTHPVTGRKALFINRVFTSHFKDMTKKESAPLLQYLYAHATAPEFTCRFRWEVDSIAFWDNRCVHHYAVNDYQGGRRVMDRVTVNGDRPR